MGIPWTAGKGRLSLPCCTWNGPSVGLTGFDMCRRYQMPDNVEPFQPNDGSHRSPGGARDPGL
ncbi:MAG: hypothetical protein QM579_04800 [Desulfovibrio sp.]|uniref:hypothetical protein n=1 Tax=Desulfovibrio sp. TaxID=885 RepID=UPI0039E28BE9